MPTKKNNFSQALIDGDIIVYRVGYAAQTKKDGVVIPDDPGWALHSAKLVVMEIVNSVKAAKYKIFLTSTDHSNYRYDIAKSKPYKGNRTQDRPVHYDLIREYLTERFKAIVVEKKEADDEMGIRSSQTENSVICTIDKDLDMIPGYHYNIVTKELYETSDPGALKLSENRRKLRGGGLLWFYAQMLMGDSGDNIPGLRGYGPVNAYKALKDFKDEEKMIKLCYNAYKKQKVEDRFLEVADLLWIQRENDERKSDYLKRAIK
jgi:hypothetical protein